MLGAYDRRGDAVAADFSGQGIGTIAQTSEGMAVSRAMATAKAARPQPIANPITGLTSAPGVLKWGLLVLVVGIIYAYRRIL
jgi:hypothetical protein